MKSNVDFDENLRNADFKLFVSFQITAGLILYKIKNHFLYFSKIRQKK